MSLTEKAAVTVAALVAGAVLFVAIRYGKSITQAAGTLATAINPANPNNVFARASDRLGASITGSNAPTLGGQLADVLQADPMKALERIEAGRRRGGPIDLRVINAEHPAGFVLPDDYYKGM